MMHSFLLIGQSNMAGRGLLHEALPVDTAHIYTLRGARWQRMFRPINPDRPFSGVSLGESFAEAYAKAHAVDVGLVCCADGGTRLEQWMPDEPLYDHAVGQARLAMRSSELKGILWHQGESDCPIALACTYGERLMIMLEQLRKDLGMEQLPVLVGGLGDFLGDCTLEGEDVEHYPMVNAALQHVAERLPLVGFVSAEGLTANPDNLHINSASLHEFGLRYFAAYEKLIG